MKYVSENILNEGSIQNRNKLDGSNSQNKPVIRGDQIRTAINMVPQHIRYATVEVNFNEYSTGFTIA